MEDSEIHNEIFKEIQRKIAEDEDKVINLFLLKNKTPSVDRLIEELNLPSFNDYLYNKYATLNKSNEISYANEENEIVWQNINEDDNYEELLTSLSKSPFLSLDTLNELLKINFIDTRQSYWPDISNKLQECFLCLNDVLFLKSLEIHYKIIMTRNCCIDGYMSLLKATNRIVKSPQFKEENSCLNNRVLTCLKVLLSSEFYMLNSVNCSNDKIMEDIIENMFALFSSQSNMQKEGMVILDFVSFIDEKADWFKYLCSSGFTKPHIARKIEKYPTLSKLIFKKFLVPLTNNLYNFSDDLDKNAHSHSCYFLVYFFNIQQNIKGFELNIHENKTYTFPQLVALVIYTINNHISSEVRETLKNFIILLFRMNQSLIDQEILEILFKPFENILKDNSVKVINKNVFLFELIQYTIKNNDKVLTEGYLYNRRKYKALFNFGQSKRNIASTNENFVNLPQLIIDITIMMMRNYINTSEKKQSVDENTLLLLECCDKIYDSHPVFLYNAMTSKFIVCLSTFYKVLNNFETTRKEIEKVLDIFNHFLKYQWNISKLFKDKILVTNIFNRVISSKIEVSSHMIFTNLSNEVSIEDELQLYLHLVVQSFLLSAWTQDDYNGNVENSLENESLLELLQFIYGISHSTKLIRILVTLCQNFEFVMEEVTSIPTLLNMFVQNVKNSSEALTGLLIVRTLISNLDGLVILQASFDLKDNLLKVQNPVDDDSDSEDECSTHNACSIVRKNINLCIYYVGHPNKLLNVCDDSIDHREMSRIKIHGTKSMHNCDLQRFLQNTRTGLHDHSWMYQLKTLFYKYCSEGYKVGVVYEIITQCPKRVQLKISRSWPESGISLPQLHKEDFVAVSIVVRYGLHIQLLTPGYRHEENLVLLLKQSRAFLDDQSEAFNGFDWFIAICFLVCSGNMERCKNFCICLTQLPSVYLVWNKFSQKFGEFWLENFSQHLDVLMAENTIIYTALKMASLSPTMIVRKWLGQCFFNILDFREICNFIIFSVLSPLEYSVYYILCLFIHNKTRICRMTHTPNLNNLLSNPKALQNREEMLDALSKERRECWVRALRRGNLSDTFLKNARICAGHFVSGEPAKLEDRDSPDWAPSVNMGYVSIKTQDGQSLKRHVRLVKRQTKHLKMVISLEDFKLTSYLTKINEFAVRYKNIIKL